MACNVEKVIKIACSEEGYLEKKNGNQKYLYDKKANAGKNNYTKYGYEMHKVYPEVMDYPAYWCDSFVDWCFYMAYGISNAKALLGGQFNDYTVASAQLFKDKGAWHNTPQVGDQVFFKNSKRINHTGIVISVDGDYFETEEGNTSSGTEVIANGGMVCRKKYKKADPKIAGFGRPAYDKQPSFTPHWIYENGVWYYRISEAKNAHGWKVINRHWYYFNSKGEMLKDWQSINGDWYYFQPKGELEGALYRTTEYGAQYIWTVN